jgi:hypothetical protein
MGELQPMGSTTPNLDAHLDLSGFNANLVSIAYQRSLRVIDSSGAPVVLDAPGAQRIEDVLVKLSEAVTWLPWLHELRADNPEEDSLIPGVEYDVTLTIRQAKQFRLVGTIHKVTKGRTDVALSEPELATMDWLRDEDV